MTVRVDVTRARDWPGRVAGLLAERFARNPRAVVCLPTGSTPLPVYARLPVELAARGASAGGATIVLLDEYVGLPAGHPGRCDATLRRVLVDRLDPPPARFIAFDVDAAAGDGSSIARAFDAAVASAGGLDLVVLGLGANGHVGLNEPGTPADAGTRVVDLAETTRTAAIGYGADPPPRRGATLGMAGILGAAEVWLLAAGAHKAAILGAALDGPATPAVPASLLRTHPRLRVLADDAARPGRSGPDQPA